jgi:hypothetical protein
MSDLEERIQTETRSEGLPTIKKVDEPISKEYFANYSQSVISQSNINNIIALNRDGAFVYETRDQEMHHVIWIYNNPESMLPIYSPLTTDSWQRVSSSESALGAANNALIEVLEKASNFYDWTNRPRGFVIDGSTSFGMEAGNFVGVRVSIAEVEPLLSALRSGETSEVNQIKTHLEASLVHELTHLDRDDGLLSQVKTEIASHIAQFIYEPVQNETFNKQIKKSLEQKRQYRDDPQAVNSSRHLYDEATYVAMHIIATRLAISNTEFKQALEVDEDPHKLNALESMQSYIRPEDRTFLKESVLPQVMATPNELLLNEVQQSHNH